MASYNLVEVYTPDKIPGITYIVFCTTTEGFPDRFREERPLRYLSYDELLVTLKSTLQPNDNISSVVLPRILIGGEKISLIRQVAANTLEKLTTDIHKTLLEKFKDKSAK